MPGLVIAGITVKVAASSETAPEVIGVERRAFAGNLRSTVRAEKRTWDVSLVEVAADELASLRTAIAGGAHVTCSGDVLGGSVTCRVRIQSVPHVRVAGGLRRDYRLSLVEV